MEENDLSTSEQRTKSREQLVAILEDTRRKLRAPGEKMPITYFDYFMLCVFLVVMIGGYPYWFFCIGIFWERPFVLLKRGIVRVRRDKELRKSLKIMYAELKLKDQQ